MKIWSLIWIFFFLPFCVKIHPSVISVPVLSTIQYTNKNPRFEKMVTTFSHRCVSSLILSERKSTCFEDEETEVFIEVDCFNIEPVLCPAPADLSQQQVTSLTLRYYYYFIYPFCCEELFYCFFPFHSWWEDVSWAPSWRVRRTTWRPWRGY